MLTVNTKSVTMVNTVMVAKATKIKEIIPRILGINVVAVDST